MFSCMSWRVQDEELCECAQRITCDRSSVQAVTACRSVHQLYGDLYLLVGVLLGVGAVLGLC